MSPRAGVSRVGRIVKLLVAAPLILLLLPLVVLLVVSYLVYGLTLQFVVWISWCTRGTNVLLVYSNSPHWQDYRTY